MQMGELLTAPVTWQALADRVLDGQPVTREEGLAVLACPDVELPDLLAATYRVRHRHWGNTVQLYTLKNAKSGLCPEDCGYCSQSKISTADIPVYRMNDEATLLADARAAAAAKSRTFCIVASGRGPSDREVQHLSGVIRKIKAELPLNVCCCLGLLSPDQARQLADAGVDRVNHNLNTSREHYDQICSTHSFDDRLETLKVVREAGMEVCSGGIVGLGERHDDVVSMAFELRALAAESIPVNFLHPIDGTPLEGSGRMNPRYCLKVLCLFRLTNPASEIRVAGGRELNLRWLQPQALYAANSIFLSHYLTTQGQGAEEDYRMIEDMGFDIMEPGPETAKGRAALQQATLAGECGGGTCRDTRCAPA